MEVLSTCGAARGKATGSARSVALMGAREGTPIAKRRTHLGYAGVEGADGLDGEVLAAQGTGRVHRQVTMREAKA